jgi:hypothetical protein
MLARLMRRRSSSPLSGLLYQGGAAAAAAPAGGATAASSLFSHHHQQHTAAAALPGLKIRDSASQVRTSSVTIVTASTFSCFANLVLVSCHDCLHLISPGTVRFNLFVLPQFIYIRFFNFFYLCVCQ